MSKKWWILLWATALLFIGAAGLQASKFAVKDWLFVWHAAKEGNVRLRIEKSPVGTLVVISSPGGSIATVEFPPQVGKSLGGILLKAERYALAHRGYYEKVKKKHNLYNQGHFDKETIPGYEVIFQSEARGENFVVKLKKDKLLTGVTLMSKDEALKMGLYLLEVNAMAQHINARVNL